MTRTARLAFSLLMVTGLGACGKKSEPKATAAPPPQVAPIAPPAAPVAAPAPRVQGAGPVVNAAPVAAPVAAPAAPAAPPKGSYKGKVTGYVGPTAIDIGLTECSSAGGKGRAKGAGFAIEFKMWAGTLSIETEGRTWQAMANLQGDGTTVSTQGVFDSQTGWNLSIVCS